MLSFRVRTAFFLLLGLAAALPMFVVVACSHDTTTPVGISGGGGPNKFPPPPAASCGTRVSSFCAAASSASFACIPCTSLEAAKRTEPWCENVATTTCAGFTVVEGRDRCTLDPTTLFYDDAGSLAMVVSTQGAGFVECRAGPPGPADPLVTGCKPPVANVCPRDAEADATLDAAAPDASAEGGE